MATDVVMVGPFPPPVHGMSTTNAAVHDHLVALGAAVTVLDTAAPNLDRSLLQRLGRLPRIAQGLWRLATLRRISQTTLYLSASGGWGQIYDVLFLLVARLRRMRIFIRHCCFSYLDDPTRLAKILTAVSGHGAVHVTQSKGMAQRLQAVYGPSHVVPISNAVLYPCAVGSARCRTTVRTLGFLSNLSTEKGVFEFLDLMTAADAAGLALFGMLAGPCQDQNIRNQVDVRLRSLKNVNYVGPVYGAQKEQFLDSIDVLIFPTRYRNETEAKVNHEAMSHGIPVIAYGRGCIPEIVGSDCGLVIDPAAPFVTTALTQLKTWLATPVAFEVASQAAMRRFARTHSENTERWVALLADVAGSHGDDLISPHDA